MRVLQLGAHGDDEILGVGGTLAKYAQEGHEVFSVIFIGKMNKELAKVIGTRYDDSVRSSSYDDNVLQLRKRQSMRAAEILGIKESRYLDYEDETLEESLLSCTIAIERLIKEIKPQIIFTHHRGDANQDHRGLFKACIVACRHFRDSPFSSIYCYETLSTTEQTPNYLEFAFLPNFYINIESVLEMKIEAMKCYEDELHNFPHPRSIEGIKTLAKMRGMSVGFKAAEAFMVYRQTLK